MISLSWDVQKKLVTGDPVKIIASVYELERIGIPEGSLETGDRGIIEYGSPFSDIVTVHFVGRSDPDHGPGSISAAWEFPQYPDGKQYLMRIGIEDV